MLPNLGIGELTIILVVALLLFGAKKLPEIGRSLGKSVKAFKSGLQESDEKDGEDSKRE